VLTARAVPANQMTADKAQAARQDADALPATDAVTRASKARAVDRARGMAKVAAKG
jgi:F-type H+-transporting ATPase subunit epsilon